LSSWKDLLGRGLYRQPIILVCYLIGFLIKRFFQNEKRVKIKKGVASYPKDLSKDDKKDSSFY
jgi:hypothetical protein